MTATSAPPAADARIRRGLLIAFGLSLGTAVSNSFARFAYALILPSMRSDLGWSYTEAGAINTANALGYLAGAWLTFRLLRRMGPARLFTISMWGLALAIAASGLTSNFSVLAMLRGLAGISGAFVFIAGGVLSASVFADDPRRAPQAIAIYFSGGGIGLLLSGVTLPWLLESAGDSAWPAAWIGMGVTAIAAAALAQMAAARVSAPVTAVRGNRWLAPAFLPTVLAYACFALGYIAYMTFVIAWMRAHGAPARDVALVWTALGVLTLLAPLIWRRPLERWRGGRPLAGALAAVTLGSALPLAGVSLPIMLLSGALFGAGMFQTPASITAFVRRTLPAGDWGEAVAGLTIVFATAQCLGPVLTGLISDVTGSLFGGLALSTCVLAAGSLIALTQREVAAQHGHA